jgi:hypothetical protein
MRRSQESLTSEKCQFELGESYGAPVARQSSLAVACDSDERDGVASWQQRTSSLSKVNRSSQGSLVNSRLHHSV